MSCFFKLYNQVNSALHVHLLHANIVMHLKGYCSKFVLHLNEGGGLARRKKEGKRVKIKTADAEELDMKTLDTIPIMQLVVSVIRISH